ncbi:hypothetical protein D3C85_1582360 [compost metagenome]
MDELSKASIRYRFPHVEIGLGTDKIIDTNGYRRVGGRQSVRAPGSRQRQGDDAGRG